MVTLDPLLNVICAAVVCWCCIVIEIFFGGPVCFNVSVEAVLHVCLYVWLYVWLYVCVVCVLVCVVVCVRCMCALMLVLKRLYVCVNVCVDVGVVCVVVCKKPTLNMCWLVGCYAVMGCLGMLVIETL